MKTVFSLITLFLTLIGFSQEHIVKLKNGSQIVGTMVNSDSVSTKINTKDGSLWVFETTEIASIEEYIPKVSGNGVYMRAELGILGGSQVSPSVLITNGYAFNSHWDVGLAMGYEHFWGSGFVPFLGTARYNLLSRHFTPFAEVLAGYEMPIRNWDNTKGGFSCGGRLGFTKLIGDRFAFSSSIGYRFAYLKEINGWWDDNFTFRQINRLEIKFGLTFK